MCSNVLSFRPPEDTALCVELIKCAGRKVQVETLTCWMKATVLTVAFPSLGQLSLPPNSSARVKGTEHKTQVLRPYDLHNDVVRSESPQKPGLHLGKHFMWWFGASPQQILSLLMGQALSCILTFKRLNCFLTAVNVFFKELLESLFLGHWFVAYVCCGVGSLFKTIPTLGSGCK